MGFRCQACIVDQTHWLNALITRQLRMGIYSRELGQWHFVGCLVAECSSVGFPGLFERHLQLAFFQWLRILSRQMKYQGVRQPGFILRWAQGMLEQKAARTTKPLRTRQLLSFLSLSHMLFLSTGAQDLLQPFRT